MCLKKWKRRTATILQAARCTLSCGRPANGGSTGAHTLHVISICNLRENDRSKPGDSLYASLSTQAINYGLAALHGGYGNANEIIVVGSLGFIATMELRL